MLTRVRRVRAAARPRPGVRMPPPQPRPASRSLLRGRLGRSRRELGKRIRDLEPRRLGRDPDVCDRTPPGVAVEDSEAESKCVRIGSDPAVDRGAAARTEGAQLTRRRLELANQVAPGLEAQVLRADGRVARERGAAGPATLGAVADGRWTQPARDPQAHPAAEALPVDHGCLPADRIGSEPLAPLEPAAALWRTKSGAPSRSSPSQAWTSIASTNFRTTRWFRSLSLPSFDRGAAPRSTDPRNGHRATGGWATARIRARP